MSRASWLALVVVGLAGCVPGFQTQNESDMLLRVIEVTNGDSEVPLISDVQSGTPPDGPFSVVNDNAIVTVEAVPKNANGPTLGAFNDVTLTSYAIRYIRSDGRGVEGIDVPYHISGNLNAVVRATGTSSEVSLVAVRHQAKEEPPLSLIVSGGGPGLLTVTGEITLYGQTLSGQSLSARGYIEIVFGDFVE